MPYLTQQRHDDAVVAASERVMRVLDLEYASQLSGYEWGVLAVGLQVVAQVLDDVAERALGRLEQGNE